MLVFVLRVARMRNYTQAYGESQASLWRGRTLGLADARNPCDVAALEAERTLDLQVACNI